MPAFLTSRFITAALAVATLSAVAAPGAAQAAKAPAPTLSIESKTCLTGAETADRSVTVTALALLGSTGERVTMRFSLQSRIGKTKWKSVLFKDPSTTKKWETTEAAGAGLKLTKTIPDLPEGFQYRVVVESRAVDTTGKVVTRTAKRYVLCNQPQFTPTLTLGKTLVAKKTPPESIQPNPVPAKDGDPPPLITPGPPPYLIVPVKNVGRLPSEEAVLTLARADTRETLSRWVVDPVKGMATVRLRISVGTDCTQLYVTVQPKGAEPTDLTVEQAAVVDCRPSADAARRSRR